MDNIEQLFPGYCALILAEIARWREYDPAINPDIVDSFRSAVVGHRDRYRAKLEQLKFANADSRKQLDQIEQEVIKFTNRVITSTIARGKIEFTEEGESKPAGRSHRPHWILAVAYLVSATRYWASRRTIK